MKKSKFSCDKVETTKKQLGSVSGKQNTTFYHRLPKHTSDATDSFCGKGFRCAVSGSPYSLTKAELDGYRRLNLSLPQLEWKTRLRQVLEARNPAELSPQRCAKGAKAIHSSFRPGDGWVVWDNKEYQRVFY